MFYRLPISIQPLSPIPNRSPYTNILVVTCCCCRNKCHEIFAFIIFNIVHLSMVSRRVFFLAPGRFVGAFEWIFSVSVCRVLLFCWNVFIYYLSFWSIFDFSHLSFFWWLCGRVDCFSLQWTFDKQINEHFFPNVFFSASSSYFRFYYPRFSLNRRQRAETLTNIYWNRIVAFVCGWYRPTTINKIQIGKSAVI